MKGTIRHLGAAVAFILGSALSAAAQGPYPYQHGPFIEPVQGDASALAVQAAQNAEEARRRAAAERQQRQRQPPQPARQPQQPQQQEQQQRRAGRGPAAEISEPFAKTVKLQRGGTFELQNMGGSITVTGGGGNEARIEAVKRVRAVSEANARAALEQIRIDVVERGGNVEVRTVQARGNPRMSFVDYTVMLPAGANVILQSVSGDVRVQRVSGEVRAESYSGNVSAAMVKRLRVLRSMTGNIDVTDGEADEFNANTLSGQIVIRKLKGRLIDLHTITGNAMLHDVAAERALLQSTAGDLEYAGRLLRTGRYQFQTHDGNIRVLPSGNPGFDLEAMTYSGDLRTDFTLKVPAAAPAAPPPDPQRRGPQRALRGTFGNAGAVLTASSFSGNIVIVKP